MDVKALETLKAKSGGRHIVHSGSRGRVPGSHHFRMYYIRTYIRILCCSVYWNVLEHIFKDCTVLSIGMCLFIIIIQCNL